MCYRTVEVLQDVDTILPKAITMLLITVSTNSIHKEGGTKRKNTRRGREKVQPLQDMERGDVERGRASFLSLARSFFRKKQSCWVGPGQSKTKPLLKKLQQILKNATAQDAEIMAAAPINQSIGQCFLNIAGIQNTDNKQITDYYKVASIHPST